jgi:hypothetical protein
MEGDPRAVFERLFGEADTAAGRRRDLEQDGSILDAVREDLARIDARLGATDRLALDEYTEAIRSVEQRIGLIEQHNDESPITAPKPLGIPESYDAHVRLMFDLLVLAYQSDITRVHTFQYDRELSLRSYPWIGVPGAHHGVSHHGGHAESLAGYVKINTYHVDLFAAFLDKMRSTPDGDGSLLDHAIFVYGSGMSDGDLHSPLDLPTVLVGGGGGLRGGRHLQYELSPTSRLSNLFVTLLEMVGATRQTVGDSTGPLPELWS